MIDSLNDPHEKKAFPRPGATGEEGMSLRDYFAGQAVIGLMSRPDTVAGLTMPDVLQKIAARCYAMADELLRARSF